MNAARTIASSTAIASQVVFATLFISAPRPPAYYDGSGGGAR
jgi:hypothetical protein